ncbi:hypothetical protein [Kordia jejudonensis]|uniref:hypothetical protein n=1 Tax=Kordia jejudonensis TaxID=1348245 RepID=UPI000629CBE6|nr:hypothetical protein [Kordia jejudonensis]
MKHIIYILLFVVFSGYSQNDALYERLQVLQNKSTTFYNIDGYTITKEVYNYEFSEKNIKKVTRKYKIKRNDKKSSMDEIGRKNIFVHKQKEIAPNLIRHATYYFIENDDKTITVIWFSQMNIKDVAFEKKMIAVILADAIPKKCYTTMEPDYINFAGRNIQRDESCFWTNLNTIQCSYNGEMNWSVHKDLKSAQNSINAQKGVTLAKKGVRIASEETVPIIFEGQETEALKIVFSFKGVKSILAGLAQGETITAYYVATKVRGNYVSCVLSHWNNDNITEGGLTALLEEVMRLKPE